MSTIPMADTAAAFQRANQLLTEAGAILANKEASADERGKVPALIEEAKRLKTEAAAYQSQLAEISALQNEIKTATNGHGNKPATNGGGPALPAGDTPPDEAQYWKRVQQPDGSEFATLEAYTKAMLLAGKRHNPIKHKNLKWFDEVDPTEAKDMAESVGASGGFLVPPEFQATLLALMGSKSILRSRATVIRMRRREVRVPVLDQTSTTAGVPHWFGGIRAFWAEEASQKTASDAVFRQLTLIAHKMIGYTRVSDELLDDAVISLTDFLMGAMGFPGVIAHMEDDAFINGDGIGKPQGIVGAAATLNVAREDQDNITYNDLTQMLQRFLPSGSGLWLASVNNLSALLQMAGPSGNPSYVWGPGPLGQTAVGRVQGVLLGYPIIFDEKVPRRTTTSDGDLLLIDPSYYLIGDRQATTMASTIYDRFDFDQTSFRAVHRVDGQPWLSAPVTLQDGITQISPFVRLGAKSTS